MKNEAAPTSAYLWQVLGKRVSVSLSLDVVDRLGPTIPEGGQPAARRGAEVGGLLLGRVRRNRELTVVEVDNFEPIGCEHAVGPSYLLTATDRDALKERIRWHKHVGG